MTTATKKVLITDYPWGSIDIESEILHAAGLKPVTVAEQDETTLVEAARDVVAIMTCWAKVTQRVIAAATDCRHVARMGIGLDNINVDAATAHGMIVTNVPDYCIQEVAEHAMALMLALGRQVGLYHWQTKQGRYNANEFPTPMLMKGKTLGIVGYGQIGRCLAAMARALGMQVIVATRSWPQPREGVECCELNELLEKADFVSLHAPLTHESHHMIGSDQFARMKPTAMLINTARGALIDTEALVDALADDQIGGAALDVQEVEPPDVTVAPYTDPRVIVTPHAAYLSPESLDDLRSRVAHQVVDYIEGRQPANIINPTVLEG